MQAMEDVTGISWEFVGTDCKSSPNLNINTNRPPGVTDCGLAIGRTYQLKCDSVGNNLGGGDGWKSNYIIIENRKYCENTRLDTTVDITITGNL